MIAWCNFDAKDSVIVITTERHFSVKRATNFFSGHGVHQLVNPACVDPACVWLFQNSQQLSKSLEIVDFQRCLHTSVPIFKQPINFICIIFYHKEERKKGKNSVIIISLCEYRCFIISFHYSQSSYKILQVILFKIPI